MYMSESEIIGKFRRADNKKEMLKVLADLNGCSNDDMKTYLVWGRDICILKYQMCCRFRIWWKT